MRNLQNLKWISVPRGFSPGPIRTNFGSFLAMVELFFYQKRKTPGQLRFYYPPPWSKSISGAQAKIFKAAQFWLIALPVLVGAASALPLNFSIGPLDVSTSGVFDISFAMRASFLSALFLFLSFLVQYFSMPNFIRDYGKVFNSLPENITKEEITAAYIGFATGALPQKIGLGSDCCYRYPGGSYTYGITIEVEYDDGSRCNLPEGPAWGYMSFLFWRLSGPLQWKAAQDYQSFFEYKVTYIMERSEPGKEDVPQLPLEDLARISEEGPNILDFEKLGLAEIITGSAYPKQMEFIFPVVFGQVRLRDESVLECYRRCYHNYDHSRCFARFIFWGLFIIGSLIGAVVFLKLLLDGISIIFF